MGYVSLPEGIIPIHGGIEPGFFTNVKGPADAPWIPLGQVQSVHGFGELHQFLRKTQPFEGPGNVLSEWIKLMCTESGWSWYISDYQWFQQIYMYIYIILYIICNYIHAYVYVCSLNGINPSFPELVRLKKNFNQFTVRHGLAHFASCRLRKRGA